MRNYNQVEAHVKSLAKPIINWDTQNIRDLKRAIDELVEYSHSEEFTSQVEDKIFEFAGVDLTDLPSAKNIDLNDVDTSDIWAVDVNGMCLMGSDFKIVSLDDAIDINNGDY